MGVLGAYRRLLANRPLTRLLARRVHLVDRGLAVPGRAADHRLRPHQGPGGARHRRRRARAAVRDPLDPGRHPGRPLRPPHDPAGHGPLPRRLHGPPGGPGDGQRADRGARGGDHPGHLLLVVLRSGDRLVPAQPGHGRGGPRPGQLGLRHAGQHRLHRRAGHRGDPPCRSRRWSWPSCSTRSRSWSWRASCGPCRRPGPAPRAAAKPRSPKGRRCRHGRGASDPAGRGRPAGEAADGDRASGRADRCHRTDALGGELRLRRARGADRGDRLRSPGRRRGGDGAAQCRHRRRRVRRRARERRAGASATAGVAARGPAPC